MTAECSIEGCERSTKTRGLCQTHYVRLWRSGSAGRAEIRLRRVTGPCSVEDCDRPSVSRDLCKMHYHRWQRHGDPMGGYTKLGTADVGYIGALHRVKAKRGAPAAYACTKCATAPAQVWAYVGPDNAARRVDPQGRNYSGDPADWSPMCRSCRALTSHTKRGCKVDSCGRPNFGQGLCTAHYKRLWRAGLLPPSVARKGSDGIAYETAHGRVRTLHGSASTHSCATCGGPACDWAYLHVGDDPDRITDERGRIYSVNIDRYAPMCAPCHRDYDALLRRP